jgi:hypothetical protein
MKSCPLCAEDVDDAADVCPHCRNVLVADGLERSSNPSALPAPPTEASLLRRLAAVEAEVARWRRRTWTIAAVLVVVAAFVLASAAQQATTTAGLHLQDGDREIELTAQGLFVKSGGERRAGIGFTDDGSGYVSVFDERGHPRIGLGVVDKNPGIAVFDAADHVRFGVTDEAEGVSMWLFDGAGKQRVGMQLSDDGGGQPQLVLADTDGKKRINLGVVDGTPQVNVNDANEQSRLGLSVVNEHPLLLMADDSDKARLTLGVDDVGPGLRFFDRAEAARLNLGLFRGASGVVAFDAAGAVRATVWNPEKGAPFVGVDDGGTTTMLQPAADVASAVVAQQGGGLPTNTNAGAKR